MRIAVSRQLLIILGLAFAVRFVYFLAILFLNPEGLVAYDTNTYYMPIATALVEQGYFGIVYDGELHLNHHRVPVFPMFLAGFLFLGIGPVLITFVQLLISTATAGIVYATARYLTGSKVAIWVAALFVVFDIPTIAYANLLLSETLFTFFFAWSVYLVVSYLVRDRRRYKLVFSALLMGLAILTRPVGVFLPLAMMVFFVIQNRFAWRRILGYPVIAYAVVLPWILRNYLVFGHVFLTTIGDVNLLYYRAAGIVAVQEGVPIPEVQQRLFREVKEEYKQGPKDPVRFAKLERKKALEIIGENKGLFLRNTVVSWGHLVAKPLRAQIDQSLGLNRDYTIMTEWGTDHKTSLWSRLVAHTSTFTLVLVAVQLLLLVALWIGFVAGLYHARPPNASLFFWIGLIFIGYFILVAGGPEADARFRIPMMPILAVVSGIGWGNLLRKRQSPA